MSRKDNNISKERFNSDLLLGTIAIVFFILSTIIIFSIFNLGGQGGGMLLNVLIKSIGVLTYLSPFILLYFCYLLWTGKLKDISKLSFLGAILILSSLLGALSLADGSLSGSVGSSLGLPLTLTIGTAPSFIAFLATAYIGMMFYTKKKNLFEFNFDRLLALVNVKQNEDGDAEGQDEEPQVKAKVSRIQNWLSYIWGNDNRKDRATRLAEAAHESEESEENEDEQGNIYDITSSSSPSGTSMGATIAKSNIRTGLLSTKYSDHLVSSMVTEDEEVEAEDQPTNEELARRDVAFVPPPVELLRIDSGKSSGGDTKAKGKIIQNTLAEFSIPVEIAGVTVGPTVTQFRVKTPQGFKVKSIMNYHDNIQMNLSAESIHIDAPIPGQSVVGIDVPNKEKQMLGLGTLIDTDEFRKSNNLTVALGKDIIGKPVYGDIDSMPHLLIAGATKSGKSVTIQNIITSLLYKNSPENLKLIIIDPKKVEFTVYKNLPHLYTPVITDAKSAIKCLSWAVGEMERRYDYFAENYEGIQNINDYNNKIYYPALEKEKKKKNPDYSSLPQKFPFVVMIFDEFNDFMISYGKEITTLITSLTQKARAAGMHLVLATQRPDVKVINGTIKANIPARLALRTSSRIDSQTILDQGGAEDLLGNGDMLFLMPGKKPQRVQAPFVSSEEIRSVIKYIKDAYYGYEPEVIDYTKASTNIGGGDVSGSSNNYNDNTGDDEEEDLYNNAKDYVIKTGRASATNLQSKFGLGFAKANRIIMMLEERGVVSPLEGNKRKVLSPENGSDNSVTDLF